MAVTLNLYRAPKATSFAPDTILLAVGQRKAHPGQTVCLAFISGVIRSYRFNDSELVPAKPEDLSKKLLNQFGDLFAAAQSYRSANPVKDTITDKPVILTGDAASGFAVVVDGASIPVSVAVFDNNDPQIFIATDARGATYFVDDRGSPVDYNGEPTSAKYAVVKS